MRDMKKRLEMQKRGERKEFKSPGLIKLKLLFTRSYVPFWLWFGGTISGICLIYLLFSIFSFYQKAGVVVIVGVFIFTLSLSLFHFYPKFLSGKYLALLAILLLVTALIGRIVILLPQIPDVFVPIAFLSIFLSLFFNLFISSFVLSVLSILFVLVSGRFELLPVLFSGGMIGAYGASVIHHRTDITRIGLWVGLTNLASVIGIGLIGNFSLQKIAVWGLWGIGSGIFSSILITVSLPYFETYFGITTDIRLLELTDLNHPLLRRLAIEAPGTYHHSILVATLAAAAAEAVGANPLLARVGAYYHDIGKITRPHFFFENVRIEGEGDNSHLRVNPNLSSKIILSHVKDGLELARIYRLPKVVVDIIAEHHGTSLIAYFYRKALLEKRGKGSVEESSFRYPGPKPRSKESAIVMLADSVEADSRFSSGKSHKGIESQIKRVINNKLKDNQLDETDLTLRDLNRIAKAFTRVMAGLSHTRGRYPEEMLKGGGEINQNQQYVERKSSHIIS